MKRYLVIIEYMNNRKNQLIIWAENPEEAKRLALRDLGKPTIYKSLTATDTKY